MATPYASMLLEAREGEAAVVPIDSVQGRAQADRRELQQFYTANRARYMIPEQRVLRIARIGPEQVAGVTASDQEIAAYYKPNKATYAAERHALAEPGGRAGPGDRQRDRRSGPRPAQRSPLRRRRRARTPR